MELADRFDGRPLRFEEVPTALQAADIVITSTGSETAIITRETVSAAMRAKRGHPIFLIDVAVPRDVEPTVGDLDGVFVYNIDDLEAATAADMAGRRAEVEKVESIVAEEVEEFMKRYRSLDALPVITALREKFEAIRGTEVDKLKRKLSHLSQEDLEVVSRATRSIVNRICHQPMIQIKDYATRDDSSAKLDTVREVFGICRQSDRGGDEVGDT